MKIRLDVLQSWLAGFGGLGFGLPCPEQGNPGQRPGPDGRIQVQAWIYDMGAIEARDYAKVMIDRLGGLKRPNGVLDVGQTARGMESARDLQTAINREILSNALFYRVGGGGMCVSDFNIVTHRGGEPNTGGMIFQGDTDHEEDTFWFLPSDKFNPDVSRNKKAGMNVLGRILKSVACGSCTIGMYACAFGKNKQSMLDLASSSGCRVFGGDTYQHAIDTKGWSTDPGGKLFSATATGAYTSIEGPQQDTWATMNVYWENRR